MKPNRFRRMEPEPRRRISFQPSPQEVLEQNLRMGSELVGQQRQLVQKILRTQEQAGRAKGKRKTELQRTELLLRMANIAKRIEIEYARMVLRQYVVGLGAAHGTNPKAMAEIQQSINKGTEEIKKLGAENRRTRDRAMLEIIEEAKKKMAQINKKIMANPSQLGTLLPRLQKAKEEYNELARRFRELEREK